MSNDENGFANAQALAYESTSSIMKLLYEGMTEKEAAALIHTYCRDSGVKAFFHKPFAWFGDRTRFQNFTNSFHFLPTKRRLQPGDAVILDVAPILEGCVADIGHTFVFGKSENEQHLKAKRLLLELRRDLPIWFASSLTTKEIWEKVDQEVKQQGFDNIHKMYPFAVLGHRVHKVPFGNFPGIIAPFGWHSLWSLAANGVTADLLGPKHKGVKTGIWAIEPHIGGEGFGAKFEELLVVEETPSGSISAKWLSDNVPHLNKDWFVS